MFVAVLCLSWLPSWSAGQDDVRADRAPDMVPLGVYLSWERTDACARHYGIDRWEDVRKRLDAVAANCVDTLWVTNMAEADLPRLIAECEKRAIRLIPSMSTIEGKIQWRWHSEGQYYDEVIPRVVQLAGESKTLAEVRWQIWGTIRSGCKGVLFYTLAPEAPNAETESLPPPDIAKTNDKIILAKEPTDLGPNALTNPDGTATPQLEEIGKAYRLLAPHKALIRRWKRTGLLVATIDSPIEGQCFIDPATGDYYAVVVNDDFHRARVAAIHLKAATTRLADIIHNQEIELEDLDVAGGSRLGRLNLAAGEGTILAIERENEKAK